MRQEQEYSIRQICEWFWEIEGRLGLLRLQERDVYIWRLLRFRLYQALAQKTGLFESSSPDARRASISARALLLGRILYDTVFRHTFRRRPVNNVVIPYMRESFGMDIHIQELLSTLPSDDKLVLYQNSLRPQPPRGSKSMCAAVVWSLIRSGFRKKPLSSAVREALDTVAGDMERRFGVRLPAATMAQGYLSSFERDLPAYKSLFRRLKAKKLYIVAGYVRYAPVVAARECGMEVIEFQHGTFTPYHLGYSFPGAEYVPYSPDRLLCFGRFWPETTPLPPDIRCDLIGAFHLPAPGMAVKEKGTILFLSQPIIAKRLLSFAIECAARLPDSRVVYHLHPSERMADYERECAGRQLPGNFTLSPPSLAVYDLLTRSEIVAGVSSTALQEGMTMGCRTIVVDMPSAEYMESVVARGDALLVKTPEEFCASLQQAPLCRDPSYYYAAPQNSF